MTGSVEYTAELVNRGIRTRSAIPDTIEVFRRRKVNVICHLEVIAFVTLLISAHCLMKLIEIFRSLHQIRIIHGTLSVKYLRHYCKTIQLDTPVIGSHSIYN